MRLYVYTEKEKGAMFAVNRVTTAEMLNSLARPLREILEAQSGLHNTSSIPCTHPSSFTSTLTPLLTPFLIHAIPYIHPHSRPYPCFSLPSSHTYSHTFTLFLTLMPFIPPFTKRFPHHALPALPYTASHFRVLPSFTLYLCFPLLSSSRLSSSYYHLSHVFPEAH